MPSDSQGLPPRPAPGIVPATFHPVMAVACDIGLGSHVDADGRAMQPSYPRGTCGLDNNRGLFEDQKLPGAGAVEHQVRLDAAGIAYSYSCSPVVSAPEPGRLALVDLLLSPIEFAVSTPVFIDSIELNTG
ncbi:MAG: hypothetical protein WBQ44_14025 [Rhodococcus sp. (in: high G+C Gram-positive bacteria)]